MSDFCCLELSFPVNEYTSFKLVCVRFCSGAGADMYVYARLYFSLSEKVYKFMYCLLYLSLAEKN